MGIARLPVLRWRLLRVVDLEVVIPDLYRACATGIYLRRSGIASINGSFFLIKAIRHQRGKTTQK